MKNLFLLVIAVVSISINAEAQKKKKKVLAGYTDKDYEIYCHGVGAEGTKLVKVYSYGKTPERAKLLAKKNAIHAILFKGVQNKVNGCQGIKPITSSPTAEIEREDFFTPFFEDGGKYLDYVALSAQGGDNMEVIKVDKKTYKVGIFVSVMYSSLRKDLEKVGVVKGLTSGF